MLAKLEIATWLAVITAATLAAWRFVLFQGHGEDRVFDLAVPAAMLFSAVSIALAATGRRKRTLQWISVACLLAFAIGRTNIFPESGALMFLVGSALALAAAVLGLFWLANLRIPLLLLSLGQLYGMTFVLFFTFGDPTVVFWSWGLFLAAGIIGLALLRGRQRTRNETRAQQDVSSP